VIYLCDIEFFAVVIKKTKYHSPLMVEEELGVDVSSLTLHFEKLCAEKQAYSLLKNIEIVNAVIL
jgi:hypothetical protein